MLPEKLGGSSYGNHIDVVTTHVSCCTAGEVVGGTLVSASVSVDFLVKCVVFERDAVVAVSLEFVLVDSGVVVGSMVPVRGSCVLFYVQVPSALRHLWRHFPFITALDMSKRSSSNSRTSDSSFSSLIRAAMSFRNELSERVWVFL